MSAHLTRHRIVSVLAALLLAAVLTPVTFGAEPAAAIPDPPLRIMALGDSLTEGRSTGAGDRLTERTCGYRYFLQEQILAELGLASGPGGSIDWVGPRSGTRNVAGTANETDSDCETAAGTQSLQDPDHAGSSGWRIDELIEGHDGVNLIQKTPSEGPEDKLPEWIDTYQPDVVIILAGWNDIVAGPAAGQGSPTSVRNDMKDLIDVIQNRSNGVKILVAGLPPAGFGSGSAADPNSIRARGTTYSGLLGPLAGQENTMVEPVKFRALGATSGFPADGAAAPDECPVPTHRAGQPDGIQCGDPVHPNELGNEWVADKLFNALNNNGYFDDAPAAPSSPTVTSANPGLVQPGSATAMTITGSGFAADATVDLGAGVTASNLTVNPTSISLTATVSGGAAAGPRNVTVTNPGLPAAAPGVCTACFNVAAPPPPPVVNGITPSSVDPNQAGVVFTLSGSNMPTGAGTADVSLGAGINVTAVTRLDAATLRVTADVTAGAVPGPRTVSVTDPGPPPSAPGTCDNCLTVVDPNSTPPAVSSVSPDTLAAGQQNAVINITGSGFGNNLVADLGSGIGVVAINVISPTQVQLTLNVGASVSGDRDVVLRNGPAGAPGICVDCLTVLPAVASGYWIVEADGDVLAFGGVPDLGGVKAQVPAGVIAVDLAAHPTGQGFWVLLSDGQVVSRGVAQDFGDVNLNAVSNPARKAGEVPAAISATGAGDGVWVFTNKGRIVSLGAATPATAMANGTTVINLDLAGDIVGSIPTGDGQGVYMVGADGGVFAIGTAPFLGSVPGVLPGGLDLPVTGIVVDPDGRGYYMVAQDGGVFAFDAVFTGSLPAIVPFSQLAAPVSGIVPFGTGYLLVAQDGGVFNFSSLPFSGSGAGQVDTLVTGIASVS